MKIALRILLTIALTWMIVSQVGVTIEELLSPGLALPSPAMGWLVLATLLLLSGYAVTARLWGKMLGELGGTDPGLVASIRIVLTANLGRYFPGKVWQITGIALLSKRQGGSATLGATAGILSRIFALAATALVALPLLLGPTASLGGAGIPLFVLLALLALTVALPRVLASLLRWTLRIARVPAGPPPAIDAWFGARWLARHLAAWILYCVAFVVFSRGLGFDADFLGFSAAFAAAYLVGYLAVFAPAGIGVREGFLIAFLRPEVGGAAVGIALLTRVWMTLAELVPAGILGSWELFRTADPSSERTAGAGSGEGKREHRA
jgi:hypothetical protein